MDLLFRGGTVITDGLEIQADLGVTDGRVTHLGTDLSADPDTVVVDVASRYLFPGAVECLVNVPAFDLHPREDMIQWITGLAGVGGATSVVIPWEPQRGRLLRDALPPLRETAEAHAYVDFGLHLKAHAADEPTRIRVREAAGLGLASLWLEPDRVAGREGDVAALAMDLAREVGDSSVLIAPLWDSLAASVQPSNSGSSASSGLSRPGSPSAQAPPPAEFPAWMETQAVRRYAAVAEATGSRLLLRSISGRGALEALKTARENGSRLLAAASLLHLVAPFDTAAAGGASVQPPCWPPLRAKADQTFLWFLLEEGLIPIITVGGGLLGAGESIPSAGVGSHPAETLVLLWPLLFTEGVLKNRLSLAAMVQAASADAAKLAGLYPAKGSLMIGADADVVVFNPEVEWQVGSAAPADSEDELDGMDAAPRDREAATPGGLFGGKTLRGAVERVYLRGRPVVAEHEMVGEPGLGRFLERRLQLR